MQLCRLRKNPWFIECTYRKVQCTWYVSGKGTPWESDTKLDGENLVSIPVRFSIPSVS